MNTQTTKTKKIAVKSIDFQYNPTQLANWKKQHGEIVAIDVIADNDELIRGIFKKPNLSIIQAADSLGGEDEILKRAEFAFTNCWIAGDSRLQLQEDLKVSAGIQVLNLFKIRASVITKL